MKKIFTLSLLFIAAVSLLCGTTIVNDDIRSWTNRGSYGSYTQTITVGAGTGTVTMTRCMVSNGAAATGTCSIGRVQMEASTGILELPALPSVGRVEFHFAAGAAGRTIALQSYNGSTWDAVTSFTGIGTTGATYYYDLNSADSTTLRLASPSAAIYLHDIIITDYSGSSPTLAVLSTAVASSITSTTAISGGTITSDGGAIVTARGVCWNTSANPTISNSVTTDGTGAGSYVSNISSLIAETQYYYRAYATNSQGTAYGEEYSFSTSGNSPPPAPVATAASSVGINSFTANWNAATGATSYRLDVSTSNTFATMLAGYNDLTINTLSQSVNGLNANTPYYYRVRAYNTIGTSASSNTINTTTLANDPFSGYYTSVSGLSGSSLKSGLHTLLRTTHTTEFSYSNLETQMKVTDEDPLNSNNVIELYTGWSVPKSSYGGGVTNWNKEHTWSKSHGDFGETAPAGTDLHHLRPCDATVNSAKSNRFFDYGSSAYTDASPPSGYTGVTGCLTATDIWEPRDADKGDVARMIFYMAVRYEGDDTSYDLELVDSVPSSSSVLPIYGKLSTLLEWNASDPPDAWEALRNSRIQSLQGNRNPFVDHPEYVTSIWGGTALTTTVTFTTTGATVNEADGSITLSVQIQNPSATTATTAQIAITSGSNSDVGNFTTRTITFPANSSANQTTSVTITNDSILEGTETIVFSLINVSGGNSAAVGNYGSFNLEIEDNDIPTPVATAATALSYSGFTANWNAAAGITDYQFDLSTTSAFTSFVGVYENYPVSATTLSISGLIAGTSYYYRVRAVYNES
ncbi:MAG: endonuclease, partial [Candidatus Cloacimonetes bacterium]|nr:endonuclease [Candidatus Cloacimonadota bacterium]